MEIDLIKRKNGWIIIYGTNDDGYMVTRSYLYYTKKEAIKRWKNEFPV